MTGDVDTCHITGYAEGDEKDHQNWACLKNDSTPKRQALIKKFPFIVNLICCKHIISPNRFSKSVGVILFCSVR